MKIDFERVQERDGAWSAEVRWEANGLVGRKEGRGRCPIEAVADAYRSLSKQYRVWSHLRRVNERRMRLRNDTGCCG